MAEKSYAFICGTARSGTSALWRLVAAHPQAAIGLERYMQRAVAGEFELQPDLFERERFFRVEPGDTFYDTLAQFGGFYDRLEPRYDDCSVYGDKIPRLYRHYGPLNERFNRPAILFILRNVFDVAASYNRRARERNNWGPNRDYRVAVADWNESIQQTLTHFDSSDILVVENETLFREDTPLAPLFAHLGLDLCQAVRQRHAEQRGQAEELQASREEALTAEQKRYLCQHADFSGYRQLLDKARTRQRLLLPKAETHVPSVVAAGKYQAADHPVIDYQYQPLPDSDVLYRGPAPTNLHDGGYLACIGGAQTMGRLVERPYPTLLGEALSLEVLNLGHGGGKPRYFSQTPGILEALNRAALVIVQVMSARGVENSVFRPVSVKNSFLADKRVATDQKPLFADHAYNRLARESDQRTLLALLEETRDNYLSQMRELLQAIRVPKLLLWFSARSPEYEPAFGSALALLGDYPHMVDRATVEALRGMADGYVEVTGAEGLPQPLRSRFDGKPVAIFEHQPCPSENTYYPSPEMHAAASDALLDTARSLLHSSPH
jgi:hypothetical protein